MFATTRFDIDDVVMRLYVIVGDAVAGFQIVASVMSLQPVVSQLPYERS